MREDPRLDERRPQVLNALRILLNNVEHPYESPYADRAALLQAFFGDPRSVMGRAVPDLTELAREFRTLGETPSHEARRAAVDAFVTRLHPVEAVIVQAHNAVARLTCAGLVVKELIRDLEETTPNGLGYIAPTVSMEPEEKRNA